MDFVLQSRSPNISELSRSPGDGRIEIKHSDRCWSQTNDLTSCWQHEVTSQIGGCSIDLCKSVRGWKFLVSLLVHSGSESQLIYLVVTFGYSADLTEEITPKEAQETMNHDENPLNIIRQSVPDENPSDEIVNGPIDHDVLAEVKLPSTIRKPAQIDTQI